jgi:hypothetical protein
MSKDKRFEVVVITDKGATFGSMCANLLTVQMNDSKVCVLDALEVLCPKG